MGAFNKPCHGAAAEWTPKGIARVGRRWRGEERGSGETHLDSHRRLRREREEAEHRRAVAAGEVAPEPERTPKEIAAEKRRAYEQEAAELDHQRVIHARSGQPPTRGLNGWGFR